MVKHTLRTLNKLVKEKEATEITRKNRVYYILHICSNGVPVSLFHSKDAEEIAKEIKIRKY